MLQRWATVTSSSVWPRWAGSEHMANTTIDETPGCAELAKVVDGALAFHLTFDGPSTAYIGATTYVTLCHSGIKAEGEPLTLYDRWDDAVEAYGDQLRELAKANKGKQCAWRRRPSVEREDGRWKVTSRLAFI